MFIQYSNGVSLLILSPGSPDYLLAIKGCEVEVGIIELWIGDQLVKKQTVAEARTNQDLPETLFEVP